MERVRVVWKTQDELRTPARRAVARIGPWPGRDDNKWEGRRARQAVRRNGTAGGSPSHNHAAAVWEAARTAASRQAAGIPAGVVDLAMVSALANHLNTCARCWSTGPLDVATPASWITWAVRSRRGLWRVFLPVLLERGIRVTGMEDVPMPPLPRARK